MTRPLRAFFQAIAALFLALAGTAHAALPPKPAGPVLDQANIIPDDQEAALAQRLSAYNAQSGRAIVVATISSLDGDDVANYANTLFRAWGIGGQKTDQGLLFLVAPNDRRVRIEVGYGLEEYMPDVLAGRIIASAVTPRFKAGDYPGGINAGLEQILTQLSRTPADAKAVAEAAAAAASQSSSSSGGGGTFASAIFWIVLIVVGISIFGRRKRGFAQRSSGIDPGIVLWGLSELARSASNRGSGWGGGGGSDWGGGGGFGGFGGGDSGGGGASGDW